MTSPFDNASADYTRLLEATVMALIIGGAIIIAAIFQVEQADARANRGAAQRAELLKGIGDVHTDLGRIKACRAS